jgi:outer membrane immunogenic protein
MRRAGITFLMATGLSLGLSATALAADMAVKAPPLPLLFDWTGWYGGVNTGYSWGRSRSTTDLNPATAVATLAYSGAVEHRGWEASIEGGYCFQQSPTTAFVTCLEARYDFPREHSSSTTTGSLTGTTIYTTSHVDPLLVGPHLGVLTNANHTMWYAAGGLAVGEVGGSSIGTGIAGTSTVNPASVWSAGWFLGAGVEQMLDQHWGLKLEYDYVRFASNGATGTYAGTNILLNYPGFPATATIGGHAYDNSVSVGINYHLH